MNANPETVIADAPPAARPVLSTLYGAAVVVAALYVGHDLVVPLVLASLLAFVLAPACSVLQRARLPRVAAVIVVVILAFAVIGALGLIVGRQVANLVEGLPTYQSTILGKWRALQQGNGLVARFAREASSAQAASAFDLGQSSNLALAKTFAQPLLGPVGTFGIVLVFTIFILMARDDLKERLVRLVGRRDLHRTILAMNDAGRRLSRYFLVQLALNTSFGIAIGSCLWTIGLPNPLLWGIVAALMRFVPYVGVVIASAPPLLLALAAVPGWSLAILVLALFLLAELVMGQVIEPLIYGHSTGLSPLAVIVATAFWALLWGPIGLLMATPLTLCLVVIGRHVAALEFLDVILGDSPPLEPQETFYQRALEGHAMTLLPAARRRIAASSLADYYDAVALPGLALAQRDLARDVLAFERLEQVHAEIEALLERLAEDAGERAGPASETALPPAWRAPAVVCVPGRGHLDDLAAAMVVRALESTGFSARMEPNAALGPSSGLDLSGARLCCLSVIEEGSSVSGIRYFVRRVRKRMPEAAVVVGLWRADRDSPVLAALRAEGTDAHLVLSIGELLAFARALSVRFGAADAAAVAEGEGLSDLPAPEATGV